jgi:hypothetical protein
VTFEFEGAFTRKVNLKTLAADNPDVVGSIGLLRAWNRFRTRPPLSEFHGRQPQCRHRAPNESRQILVQLRPR